MKRTKHFWISILVLFFCLFACQPHVSARNFQPAIDKTPFARLELLEDQGFGRLLGASLSPDDTALLFVSSIGVWLVEDFQNPQPTQLLQATPEYGLHLSALILWSPDKAMVAVGQQDYGFWIFDSKSWLLLADLPGCPRFECNSYSRGAAWSPDSRFFAMRGRGEEIAIWDVLQETTEHVSVPRGFHGLLWDQTHGLLSMQQGAPENFGLVDPYTDKLIFPVESWATPDGLAEMFWSPDGEYGYQIFDLGALVFEKRTGEVVYSVCCGSPISWSPDGRFLATRQTLGQEGSAVNLWDSATGIERQVALSPYWIGSLFRDSMGELFALGQTENQLLFFGVETGELLFTLTQPLPGFPDQDVVVLHNSEHVWLWSMERNVHERIDLPESVIHAQVSENFDEIAFVTSDCGVLFWRTGFFETREQFSKDDLCAGSFSPLLTYGYLWSYQNYKLIDLQKEEMLAQYGGRSRLAWHPAEDYLALERGERLLVYQMPEFLIAWEAEGGIPSWSPDGSLLAYAIRNDGLVKIVDGATGVSVAEILQPGVGAIEWSSDNRTIAFLARGLMIVYSIDNARAMPIGVSQEEYSFSPDGKILATVLGDVISLWDPDTGLLLDRQRSDGQRDLRIQWSRDGRFLFSRGWEGVSRIWQVVVED